MSQSTIFQLCLDRSSWVEPVLSKDKCVLHKDTVTPVRLQPVAPQSRVKHSTTEPLCSLRGFGEIKIKSLPNWYWSSLQNWSGCVFIHIKMFLFVFFICIQIWWQVWQISMNVQKCSISFMVNVLKFQTLFSFCFQIKFLLSGLEFTKCLSE